MRERAYRALPRRRGNVAHNCARLTLAPEWTPRINDTMHRFRNRSATPRQPRCGRCCPASASCAMSAAVSTADLCEHCRAAHCPDSQCHARDAHCPLPVAPKQRCDACRSHAPPYARTVAALRYAEPVTRMIHRLKFHGSPHRRARTRQSARVALSRRVFGSAPCAGPDRSRAAQPARLLRRGHNQAALLARWVGSALVRTRLAAGVFAIRRRKPASSRAARLRNLTDAFATNRSFRRSMRGGGRRRDDDRYDRHLARPNAARGRCDGGPRLGCCTHAATDEQRIAP